ncbi:MAG TPA: nucleoside-diphosphate kinase [Firmicutes bacterium]|nr:nucleoside-diphosphate kinase [Bacillota bacterium]
MDRTFIMIKPDGIQRGLVGEIIHRFEMRGMKIVALKLMKISEELAQKHYAEHVGKKFFPTLLKYITSAPVIVAIIEGLDAVQQVRKMVGSTLPSEAAVGTIRHDYGQELPLNVIHASDSHSSAEREIGLYFDDDEILEYELDEYKWVFSFQDD